MFNSGNLFMKFVSFSNLWKESLLRIYEKRKGNRDTVLCSIIRNYSEVRTKLPVPNGNRYEYLTRKVFSKSLKLFIEELKLTINTTFRSAQSWYFKFIFLKLLYLTTRNPSATTCEASDGKLASLDTVIQWSVQLQLKESLLLSYHSWIGTGESRCYIGNAFLIKYFKL